MNHAQLILTIGIIHLLATMRPGPNLLLSAKIGSSSTKKISLTATAGIATGALIHVILGFLGFTAIIISSPQLYQILRLIFAIYLIFLGLKALIFTKKNFNTDNSRMKQLVINSKFKAFTLGLMTMLINVLAATHFIGLFTVFIPTDTPIIVKIIIIIILPAISFVWFSITAVAFSSGKIRKVFDRFQYLIDASFGIIMITLGLRVVYKTYK